jgi:hypothetical protein
MIGIEICAEGPMFHCVFAISLFLQTSPDTKEIGEWGRTITEVYMTWYTFFVTANLLVMGWFYSKDVSNHKPLIPVSLLFLCLDILGAFSTGLVGYYMAKEVPADFRGLVAWAAGVTAVALLGVGFVWVYLIKITLTHHKSPGRASK